MSAYMSWMMSRWLRYIACHLLSIGEPSIIELAGEDGGKSRPDTLEKQQIVTLALRGLTWRRRLITLMLDLDKLLLHQGQSLDLPCDLPAEKLRQGPAVCRDQIRRRQALIVPLDIDPANALAEVRWSQKIGQLFKVYSTI